MLFLEIIVKINTARLLNRIASFCKQNAVSILGGSYLTAILCINSVPLGTLIKIAPILYVFGLVLLLITHSGSKKRLLIVFGAIYLLSMIFEIVAINFQSLLGEHSFGSTLGLKVFEVPLAMGGNWFLLVIGADYFSRWIFDSVLARILSGTILLLIAYFIMDPVAQSLNFWQWENFSVIWNNYLARAILGLLMQTAFVLYIKDEKNHFAAYYYSLNMLFFIIVNIIL